VNVNVVGRSVTADLLAQIQTWKNHRSFGVSWVLAIGLALAASRPRTGHSWRIFIQGDGF